MKILKRGMKRSVFHFLRKSFSSIVIISLFLQPVGTPGIWGLISFNTLFVFAADEEPAPVVESVPVEEEEPSEEVAEPQSDEEESVPEEESASTENEDESTPVEESVASDSSAVSEETAEEDVIATDQSETAEEAVPVEETTAAPEVPTEETTPTISESEDVAQSSDENPVETAVESQETPVEAASITETAEPLPTEQCLSASVTESDEGDWNVSGDSATTKEKVALGVRYAFPLDENVTLTFTCLPTDSSKLSTLKIERIKASDIDLPSGMIAVSQYAYDITTDMENGTFKYDLSLPKFEGVDEADISYIEMSADEVRGADLKKSDVKKVDNDSVDNNEESVEASNVDHFTIVFPSVNVVCQNDVEGANDESGQKDLTLMCRTTDNSSPLLTKWNWDDISWTGNNTGDACNLFDTDGDGDVNYAVCVTIGGSPAEIQSTSRYSCGDNKADRCTNPITSLAVSPDTSCEISITNTDPFSAGSNFPSDTQAICSIDLDDVGGSASAKLIDVCSYPSQQPNSDPSDCIIATSQQTGKLEVVKSLVPANDSGLFNLSVDGSVLATGVGDGGTTGEQVVLASAGSGTPHTFGEAGNGGTNLGNYSTSVVCKDGNGLGSVVSTTGSNPWTVNVVKDKDIVCTITNTLNTGSIVIIKDSVPNDAQDFSFTATGTGLSNFSLDDDSDGALSNTKTFTGILPGSYTVTETGTTGFNLSNLVCVDPTTNSSADLGTGTASINLAANETVTCTFTNTKEATLTVVKMVTNDNGGTKQATDFPLFVDGNSVTHNVANVFPLGAHTVTETGQSGYSFVSFGGDCDAQGQVTLNAGDVKTCTVTNDDQSGTLIVRKVVVNDNGGDATADDFTFQVNNGSAVPFEADGENQLAVDAGSYTVTEPSVTGYSTTYDNCSLVTVANGGSSICTITNDDNAPALTLIKSVNNNNGGTAEASAWTLTASGPTGFSGAGPSVSNGASFDAGTYTLTESGPNGYSSSPNNWVCIGGAQQTGSNAVTLGLGESATCTIVNDDIAPSLTLIKHVTNDNGGDAVAADWTLTATGPTTLSGAGGATSDSTFAAGTYSLSESAGPSGYTASAWSCVKNNDAPVAGDSVDVGLGDNVVCSITNDDVAPTITLIKNVVNDNGGQAGVNSFGLTTGGTPVTSGQILAVSANTPIVLNETGLTGYSFVSITGDSCPQTLGGTVTLNEGQNVTCTITNDDQAGTLIVKKTLINDNGGNASVTDFSFKVNNGSSLFFEGDAQNDISVSAGTYSVAEDSVSGYGTTYDNCSQVVIPNGGSATCTITNNDVAPTITLNKVVSNNSGGTAGVNDFGLTIGGTAVTSGQTLNVNANTPIALNENGLLGYSFVSLTGDGCPQSLGGTVTLNEGQNVTCTITNDDQRASLTVIKHVVNDNGGTAVAGDFTMNVIGTDLSEADLSNESFPGAEDPGTTVTLDAGSYSVDEDAFVGYTKTLGADCSGTIALGETKTCTITNDDQSATLIVKKVLLTDNGGDAVIEDFSYKVNGGDSVFFEADGQNDATVNAGTYSILEDSVPGYTTTYENCTDVVLSSGGTATCTITNDDIAPTLTLVKTVVNDNGGTKEVSDFPLFINGSPVTSGVAATLLANTLYTASETNLPGYAPSVWGGDCAENGAITLQPGESKTCTITNDDQFGKIIIEKQTNPDGDLQSFEFDPSWSETNFTLADGQTLDSGILLPGTYSVSELALPGWDLASVTCSDQSAVTAINISAGETVTCTFTNEKHGQIIVTKVNDENGDGTIDEGEEVLSDWTINLDEASQTTGEDGVTTFSNLPSGPYTLGENMQVGWNQTNIICADASVAEEPPVAEESNNICHQTASSAHPWNAISVPINNHVHEGHGADFPYAGPVDAAGHPQSVVGEQWCADHVNDVQENISQSLDISEEVNLEAEQTKVINLDPGETVTCSILNTFIPPVLNIEKTNDTLGAALSPGDEVTYTILVTAPDTNTSPVSEVEVTDLPPAGFTFIAGSDIASAGSLTHVYASPGVWSLGTMNPGSTVTLSYKAQIAESQDSGTYNDLAYARGTSAVNSVVLASSVSDPLTPFVGTDVLVDEPNAPTVVALNTRVERDVDTDTERRVKRVLGASLPETGANSLWLFVFIALLLSGLGLTFLARKKKDQNFSQSNSMKSLQFFLFISVFLVFGQTASAASSLSIKIETPDATSNTADFKIGFVALDIENRPVTVECFKDSDGVPFASYALISGGSSGDCEVNASVLPTDGTYQFHVTASAGSDSMASETVTVAVSSIVPGTPINYLRTDLACSHQMSFTTASDGDITTKVELYRATTTNFTADSGTLVGELAIGSGQNGSIMDTPSSCEGTYFYAIRAVADNGNGSAFVGDEGVTVDHEHRQRTTTVTRRIAAPTPSGAIAVTNNAAFPGAPEGSIEGAATEEGNTGEETTAAGQGLVLGAETSIKDATNVAKGFVQNNPWWSALIGAVVLVLSFIGYQMYRMKRDENFLP